MVQVTLPLSRSAAATAMRPAADAKPDHGITFTPALERELAPIYARMKHVVTPMEWVQYAPLVKAINDLKDERNAVILAHNYMTPEIFHCVGGFPRRQLAAGAEAASAKADVIVQAGVHFMAETRSCCRRTRRC